MGDDRKRDDNGRFEPVHTDDAVLDAVRDQAPAGTQEVADALGIARQSADYRLRRLLAAGRVSKKKVGNSLVWSVAE